MEESTRPAPSATQASCSSTFRHPFLGRVTTVLSSEPVLKEEVKTKEPMD